MIRNLKALGLALVAIFALSAMAASAASAQSTQGILTSDGPVTLDGVEDGENWFKYPGLPGQVECKGSTVTGHKKEVTPHELIPTGSTTTTITPTFINCKNGTSKVTVTMNGCDFLFHIGETTEHVEHGHYALVADVICPAGKVIEVHQYFAENNENVLTCTVKVPGQTGLKFDIANELEADKKTTAETLTVTGTSAKVTASKEGLCGSGETSVAEQRINFTITGTNASKEKTGITITDTAL